MNTILLDKLINQNKTNYDFSLTPELKINITNLLYLIRVNDNETCFVESESDAILAIDSIAASESEFLENEWVRVLRRELPNKKGIVISTQSLGRVIDGPLIDHMTIDYVPVPLSNLLKGRLEKVRSTNTYTEREINQQTSNKNISDTRLLIQQKKEDLENRKKKKLLKDKIYVEHQDNTLGEFKCLNDKNIEFGENSDGLGETYDI